MPKKRTLWTRILALLLVMVIGTIYQSSVEAAELNFSAKPIYPDNQTSPGLGYYDLHVTPGQQQTLELELTNQSDKPITVLVKATNATTSNNGQINYQDFDAKPNSTMKYPLATILHVEEKQVLQPKEVKKVPMTLDVPPEPFDGMILGGLYLTQEDQGEEEKGEGQIQIVNKFAYEFSVKLTENDNPVQPKLEMLSARGIRYLNENVMQAQLQNPEPMILEHLKVDAKVYKKGSQTVLYKKKSDDVRMAPNSDFYYSVPLKVLQDGKEQSAAFVAGTYEMDVTASNEQGKWQFRKEFEITKEDATKMNKEAEEQEELVYPINWLLWIGIGSGVFILILATVVTLTLVISKKKNKKRSHSKKGKTSRKKSSSKKKK